MDLPNNYGACIARIAELEEMNKVLRDEIAMFRSATIPPSVPVKPAPVAAPVPAKKAPEPVAVKAKPPVKKPALRR